MENLGFYEVSAQVIPILFFALLFQLGTFDHSGDKDSGETDAGVELFLLSVVVFAAVGEFTCVAALAEDRTPTQIEKVVVGGAITLLFLPVIIRAARPRFQAIGETLPWMRPIGTIMQILLGFGILGVAVSGVQPAPVVAIAAFIFILIVMAGSVIADAIKLGRLVWPRRSKRR